MRIKPGLYRLSVDNEKILFKVGRNQYSIYNSLLMNTGSAPIDCLEESSHPDRIYPLKPHPSNRFTLGKYAEIEIIIHFNHVQIKMKEARSGS